MTMGSWCQWAACQSPQLEAVLAQALLELAVPPDTELLERGGPGDLRVVCKARLRLTAIMFDIMMQPPASSSTADPPCTGTKGDRWIPYAQDTVARCTKAGALLLPPIARVCVPT